MVQTAAGDSSGTEVSSSVQVRRARLEDLPRILEVEEAAFSTPWSETSFRTLMPLSRVIVRVAEVDGRVVGHGVVWRVADEGELANLAVDPEVHGHGVGRILLDHLLEEAREAGITHVFLEVRESNLPARRLYSSRGFREVGIRRSYYRRPTEDALVLRVELESAETSTQVTDPSAEATGSPPESTGPSADDPDPSAEDPGSPAEVSGPSAESTDPSAGKTEPSAESPDPSRDDSQPR